MHMQTVAPPTFRFIESAVAALNKTEALDAPFRRHFRYPWSRHIAPTSVQDCKELILNLEDMAKRLDYQSMEISASALPVDARYPVFRETLEVIPIYKESIALECNKPMVLPSQIPRQIGRAHV